MLEILRCLEAGASIQFVPLQVSKAMLKKFLVWKRDLATAPSSFDT